MGRQRFPKNTVVTQHWLLLVHREAPPSPSTWFGVHVAAAASGVGTIMVPSDRGSHELAAPGNLEQGGVADRMRR